MPSRKSLGKVSYPSKSQAPAGASAADSKKKAPQLLHQDSLRADIEAARESMGSPESAKPSMASLTATTAKSGDNGGQEEEEEDGGLDLADELLAALDARRDADDGVKTAGAQSESGVRSMFNGGMKKKSKAQVKKFVCGGGGSTGCTEESTYGLQEHETCGRRVYASRAHPDDFLPFIADGDVVTGAKEQVGPISESKGPEAHFEGYCSA